MRLDIDLITLHTILNSKTLSKIFDRIIGGIIDIETRYDRVTGIRFSMENLRKSLGYKNKSTVSRGLNALAKLGLFEITTDNQGTSLDFNPDKVRRVENKRG